MAIAERLLMGGAGFVLLNEGVGLAVIALFGAAFGFGVEVLTDSAMLFVAAGVAAFAAVVLMAWWPRVAACVGALLVLGVNLLLIPLLGVETLAWTILPGGLAVAAAVLTFQRRPQPARSWIPVP